jgi:hypothetical protein
MYNFKKCISPTVFNENKFKNVAEFNKYMKEELVWKK